MIGSVPQADAVTTAVEGQPKSLLDRKKTQNLLGLFSSILEKQKLEDTPNKKTNTINPHEAREKLEQKKGIGPSQKEQPKFFKNKETQLEFAEQSKMGKSSKEGQDKNLSILNKKDLKDTPHEVKPSDSKRPLEKEKRSKLKTQETSLESLNMLATPTLFGMQNTLGQQNNKTASGTETEVQGESTRKKDKRKERITLEIHDYRSVQIPSADKVDTTTKEQNPKTTNQTDMILSLRADAGENNTRTEARSSITGSTSSFAELLSRELHDHAAADIVKHASIILKDADKGTIRLSLKPEALGAIKIHLELTDNKIAGNILVETDEALKAFEKEIQALEQAFLEGGFDGVRLGLTLSSEGKEHDRQRQDKAQAQSFFSERFIAYDNSTGSIQESEEQRNTLINILI